MKLNLDTTFTTPRHVSAEAEALAAWYDSRPTIRRLWAVRDGQTLSVIVTLEPTVDNSDTYPAWFACSHGWAGELQVLAGSPVKLVLLDEPMGDEFEVDLEGDIVTAINWRDPTFLWNAD